MIYIYIILLSLYLFFLVWRLKKKLIGQLHIADAAFLILMISWINHILKYLNVPFVHPLFQKLTINYICILFIFIIIFIQFYLLNINFFSSIKLIYVPLKKIFKWVVAIIILDLIIKIILIKILSHFDFGNSFGKMFSLNALANPYYVYLLILLFCIIGPIVEEITLRGVLFSSLRKSFSAIVTILLCAIIFSLMHAVPQMIIAFWGGLILSYAREKTGSLTVPIAIHIVSNTIVIIILLFFN